jgi:ATP-binding cassette, subfamily C, bacterial CydC
VSNLPLPGAARPPRFRLWRCAILLAVLALFCGTLLGGLSLWFLASVAIAGLSPLAYTFNFHIPAALVRLFAVGRTAAKYGERVVGHEAALADQSARRLRLFGTMATAPITRGASWQLGRPEWLADYLDDVEDIDYAGLRVDLPALTMAIGVALCLGASAWIVPWALVPIAALIGATGLVALAQAGPMARALSDMRRSQGAGATALGSALAAVVPLQAEGDWGTRIELALGCFARAEQHVLSLRRRQARIDALAGLIGPGAALGTFAAAWIAGLRGDGLLIPGFLAFSWLALAESTQGVSRMLLAQLRRMAAKSAFGAWEDGAKSPAATTGVLSSLRLFGLRRLTPGGRALGKPLDATFRMGMPTAIVGPSGCGKTSLLKQIAGWIGADDLIADGRIVSVASRRAFSQFCPHDAAILSDSVRANLFAPARSDDELWSALEAVELGGRIRRGGGLDAWITQDSLSLGEAQRLNLARVFLSRGPIVLLDEPAEHLDEAQGRRIVARLLERLDDRIVVYASHRGDVPGTARRIQL